MKASKFDFFNFQTETNAIFFKHNKKGVWTDDHKEGTLVLHKPDGETRELKFENDEMKLENDDEQTVRFLKKLIYGSE